MKNLTDYIDKYGDISFDNKEFNDIDNLIFSSLIYLDFSKTNIYNGEYTIHTIADEYISMNKYENVKKIAILQDDVYMLIQAIKDKVRYKDIVLSDYVYKFSHNMQFSALTFNISKKLKYICFEGTDTLVSGWREDFELACYFPVPSHIEAIEYVNRNVSLFGPSVIIGGHSKGGNLALISAMFMTWYKKIKVKKVYSNDGPGLRKKEFESRRYKRIKKKFIHIVPDCSIVGILLRNDTYIVVKSNKNNIIGHFISTWLIDDDKLVPSELSNTSINLQNSMISWLNLHNDYERKIMTDRIFKVFEEAGVKDIMDLKSIKNIVKVLYNIKNMDSATKELLIDLIVYNYKNTKN